MINNGVYTIYVRGVNNVGKAGEWTSSKIHIDADLPVISQRTIDNITQSGARITFQVSDANFVSGTGTIIAYTGSNTANLAETGTLTLVYNTGSGS